MVKRMPHLDTRRENFLWIFSHKQMIIFHSTQREFSRQPKWEDIEACLGLEPSIKYRVADAGAHGEKMTDAKNKVVFLLMNINEYY